MLYDRIFLEKHIYVATEAERIQNSKHWILTLNTDGGTHEKRMQTIARRAPGKDPRRIQSLPRSQQVRQRKGQQFEGNEEYDYVVDPEQVGGSTKGRGETCRQLRQDRGPTCRQLRHRRQSGTKPIGRRAIGILSILQALTSGEIFSELGQV